MIFILFGFICIVGVIAKDCSSIGHYIFSEENLLNDNLRVIKMELLLLILIYVLMEMMS